MERLANLRACASITRIYKGFINTVLKSCIVIFFNLNPVLERKTPSLLMRLTMVVQRMDVAGAHLFDNPLKKRSRLPLACMERETEQELNGDDAVIVK